MIDLGAACDVEDSRNLLKLGLRRACDKQNSGAMRREDAAEGGVQILPRNRLSIDFQRAVLADADHDLDAIRPAELFAAGSGVCA